MPLIARLLFDDVSIDFRTAFEVRYLRRFFDTLYIEGRRHCRCADISPPPDTELMPRWFRHAGRRLAESQPLGLPLSRCLFSSASFSLP